MPSYRLLSQQWYKVWDSSCEVGLKSNNKVDGYSHDIQKAIASVGKYCQASLYCSCYSQMKLIYDYFYSEVACIALCSTVKEDNGMKFPNE